MPSPPPSSNGTPTPRHSSSAMLRRRSTSRLSLHSRAHSRRDSLSKVGGDDDVKTAVKVAVRVRPPLDPSDPSYDLIPQRFRRSTCEVNSPTTLSVQSPQGKKLFVFDRVFSDQEDQEAVWDYVSDSVNSFLQGYNVSILAYGQSGAGKSYTMGTSTPEEQNDADAKGIIPRAAAALFKQLSGLGSARQPNGTPSLRTPTRYTMPGRPATPADGNAEENSWQLKATYVEIYNEQLRDLLVPDTVPQTERTPVTIREDPKGRILLAGLQQVSINSVGDLLKALNFGSSIRQTDATAINSQSSRSHAVFSLNFVQRRSKAALSSPGKRSSVSTDPYNGDTQVTIDSKLHFVDLAGSERLKNSGLSGSRVKEGISINAGLASLGKVISQLSSRAPGSHVSFRDSRLTRLLQDSLGGNAITYMVACLNPVEFHLSETVNTVQYAQRARAIQSRPQIQQRLDDGDKQIIIDRLRSEVAFLRDQIKDSERNSKRSNLNQDRSSRTEERAIELQNQLLDIQESYSALSQRHAKLISEIAKQQEEVVEPPALEAVLNNSSLERLNRSSTFAEAVEQVVLEYEKTIQSLEASLSNTRSSLSTSESSLLEREAKIVYLEAVTQKMQGRIHKCMDREVNSEHHLRDLEARLDGISSGEEKHLVVIDDLRKELSRIRESESSAEEYISTLEERLAEAEQDTDIMQREIARLEHVVERQRTIGKMDNVLHELDTTQHQKIAKVNGHKANQRESSSTDAFHDLLVGTASPRHTRGTSRRESAEKEWKSFGPADSDEEGPSQPTSPKFGNSNRAHTQVDSSNSPHSSAQVTAIADKLETVTSELFDLKVDHESTMAELDDVSRKYQIALSTLAELQDAVDEARQIRPNSFLAHAGMRELREDGPRSSSRMLSSDFSSLGESPTLVEASEPSRSDKGESGELAPMLYKEETLAESIRRLKRVNAEKDINMAELTENYAQLQDQHKDTLNYIEELKEELSRVQPSQASPAQSHLLRHSNDQGGTISDRETRVFAALRNLALERFESQPEARETFETNLDAAMTDSRLRAGRLQVLENDVATLRKEMDTKNTMLAGLARERSRRTPGTMSMSMLSTVRDHLVQSQKQISVLHELNHAENENFLEVVHSLKVTPRSEAVPEVTAPHGEHVPGEFPPETPAGASKEFALSPSSEPSSKGDNHQQSGSILHNLISDWEPKHRAFMESNRTFTQQLTRLLSGLEASLLNAENLHTEQAAASELRGDIQDEMISNVDALRAQHHEQVSAMQKDIDGHKATAELHAARLSRLETENTQLMRNLKEATKSKAVAENDLQTHRDLIMDLEDQIDRAKSLANFHQQGIKSLQESHSKELTELNAKLAKHQAESDTRMNEEMQKHNASISVLQEELTTAHTERAQLMQGVPPAMNENADSGTLHSRPKYLADEHGRLLGKDDVASEALLATQRELHDAKQINVELERRLRELSALHEQTVQHLESSSKKEQSSSRLMRELEDQLHSSFEQQQDTSNRLSTSQKERADVEKELGEHRTKVGHLEVQLADMKRLSQSPTSHQSHRELKDIRNDDSSLRASNSHTSLPSPPPAVPLPPLPDSLTAPAGDPAGSPSSSAYSPPGSGHTSKNMEMTQLLEEQEVRIRKMEKHLYAEKQLTQTLEEALVDLETQANKTKEEVEAWKKKCREVEEEANSLRRERGTMRNSLQAVEEERDRRIRAEQARRQLEERMEALSKKTKKKNNLNCF